MSGLKRVAVVGGGLAGLASAYFIRAARPEWRVEVFERELALGGKVQTSQRGGFVFDWGANGFLANVPETLELAERLGLQSELQSAAEIAKHRFIYQDGGLRPLPASPPGFIKSELLSPAGKMRAGLELLRGQASDKEETVYGFAERHFGSEFADVFAGVGVVGITAGDAKALSLDALFPRLRRLEREHGSLLRGLMKARRDAERAPQGRLTSFKGGVGRLIEALGEALEACVHLGASVLSCTPLSTSLGEGEVGFDLTLSSGETLRVDALVLATPAFVSAGLLESFLPEAARALATIPYADVSVAGLGYDRVDVPRELNGFGFLVPRGEGVRSLGVLWSSAIFSDQAPPGKVMLRVIGGGVLEPDFTKLPPREALDIVRRDLRLSMGITAEPEFTELIVWPKGIPQYLLGHAHKVAGVMKAARAHPGLLLTGNAYYGVGLNDCVRDAQRVANELCL